MQWSGEDGAGFTSGEPWLKIHPNYKDVNVLADSAEDDGVIKFFKEMNSLKKSSDVLKEGSFKEIYAGRHIYIFQREYNGQRLLAMCNFSTRERVLPLLSVGERIIGNYESDMKPNVIRPYEFALCKAPIKKVREEKK
jgi:glycosidase